MTTMNNIASILLNRQYSESEQVYRNFEAETTHFQELFRHLKVSYIEEDTREKSIFLFLYYSQH